MCRAGFFAGGFSPPAGLWAPRYESPDRLCRRIRLTWGLFHASGLFVCVGLRCYSTMEFVEKSIQAYADAHTEPEPPLLAALSRATHIQSLYPRMLSGHGQGRLLALISRLVQPRRILEIGTFTGYSALCLAEGLQPHGQLYTLEIEPENVDFARTWLEKADEAARIHCLQGHATQLIPTLEGPFDLAFMDGRKEEYRDYYEALLPKMRRGGLILTDNVLWSGQVLDKKPTDPAARALQAFNIFVLQDPRVFNVLLPVRDGLMMNLVV